MHTLFRTLAAALALGTAQYAGAAVIHFDQPGLIEIDNDTNRALYREGAFALTGEAAGFLTIDGLGSAMSGALVLLDGSVISLMRQDGELFSFSGLVAGRLDAQTPASLSLTGIFGDQGRRSETVALADLGSITLPMWTGLTELRLSAAGDLVLDDIVVGGPDGVPVPEPASIAMLVLGLGALAAIRRRVAVAAS